MGAAVLAATYVAGLGCGGAPAATGRQVTPLGPPTPDRPAERVADPPPDVDEPDPDGLEVESTRGSVDPSVVSERLEPRAAALEACYSTRVGRRRWLGGGLELTWDVRADGSVAAVSVSASDLGAWPIEKCVLGVARGISFGKPRGNKPARVSAPISFSAGSGAVRWDQASADKAVGGRLAKLASCAGGGDGGPRDVTITLYLGTRGKVETVGFASPRGFDEAWADCAERAILGWSLTDPRGKVAKLSVTYNATPGGFDAGLEDEQDL